MSDTDSPQVSSPASDASDDSDDGNASDSEKVQRSSSEAIHIVCYKRYSAALVKQFTFCVIKGTAQL